MRFDFVPIYSAGEPLAWHQVAQQMREEAVLAEELGFEGVWVGEHHFATPATDNGGPNPVLMCADIAARTSHIRVGTIPLVLPDRHPLHVAEEVAMLDQMTLGRVDFGAGRGVNDRTSIQFRPEADRSNDDQNYRLFIEDLEIIVKAWTEDPFSHRGEFYTLPVPGWKEHNQAYYPLDRWYFNEANEFIGMDVRPKTYQKPHPPVWVTSEKLKSHEFAAERGYGMLSWAAHRGRALENWTRYREIASRIEGRDVAMRERMGVMQVVYVAPTMEEAIRDTRHGVNDLWFNATGGGSKPDVWSRQWWAETGEQLTDADMNDDWFDFLRKRDRVWVGTPEYVAERIAAYEEDIGLQHLIVWPQLHRLTHAKVMTSIELFAGKVMPKFRRMAVGVG